MILVAVVIGYILGAIPFVLPKIVENINEKTKIEKETKEDKEEKEIFDEWLNGPKEETNKENEKTNQRNSNVNQADIYNEYITGQETVKGD